MAGLEKAFELAVVISAVDKLTAPARAMAAQLGIVSKQTEALQKRMASFKAMAVTGGVITGIGGAMALGLVKAAESAGQLQTAVMGVKEALKLTNAEYTKAMNLSQTVGIPTIFSAVQVSGIMQAMATAGLTKQQVLNPAILRDYVNFADVQAQIKKENAPDVVSTAVSMAHQYQLYSTAQITPFLNQLNAALLHTHETASEFGTTYKYIANQARTMGMGASSTLAATAWLGRMGFGNGRGGTNFADFLRRSIYGSSGKKADAAMQAAGFVQNGHSVFTTANGQFVGVPAAVKIMQDFAARFHGNANLMSPLLNSIFGTQGARIAMMMSSSGASEQYTNVQKQIAGTASISKTQSDLNNTWAGKVKQLQTTLQDIGQAFGRSVMPVLLPVIKGLDDILGRVLKFEQQHPKIMKWIATFASIATAVMLVVGPTMLLVGALGYLKTSQAISAGFQILGRSLLGALGPIAIVAGAAYLLYEAWTHNWGGIQQKTAAVWNWVKTETPKVWNTVLRVIRAVWSTIGPTITKTATSVWNTLRGAWTQVAAFVRTIWPEVLQITRFVWHLIYDYIRAELQLTWIVVRTISKVIWTTLKAAWTLISTDVKVVWRMIKDTIQIAWDVVSTIIKVGLDLLTGHWRKAWLDIVSGVQKWWKDIQKFFLDGWNGLQTLMTTWLKTAETWGSGIVSSIWNGIKSLWPWLKQNFANFAKDILPGWAIQLLSKAGLNLASTSSSLPTNVVSQGHSTTIHIHPGAIQVNGATDGAQFANDFMNQLGTTARQNNMSRPFGPNRLVYGH
ncbi:phage tail tape measure protein [Alicyclobacillus tolerans]|uniref:phage tail tape measure protein n=1 Tax=Alicyclobacillus tolerans TaxID=90970 RepID=UPI001F00B277|nr:phage tail tape measure protein [Alicyclobacillus tolerans]MCF8566915.1 phage tail tape measure protein [Alicyclobacillus tolerans]